MSFILYVAFPVSLIRLTPSFISSDVSRYSQNDIYYVFTCVFPSISSPYPLIWVKELRLSGKCNEHFPLWLYGHAHESSRYTNTLLVSLNNRIYFRDHPSPGVHVDTSHFDQGHRSAMTSLHFAQVGSHTHTTTLGDGYKVKTTSHTTDPEKGKGDNDSI